MAETRIDSIRAGASPAPQPARPNEEEDQRLAALYRYGVLDTGAEPAFDALASLAAWACDASSALISLVDRDRLWFKAHIGFDPESAPRREAPCAEAITEPGELLVLGDAQADPRFAGHPAFGAANGNGHGGWRFYAGAPLVTPQGWPVGTLCVLDREPKALTERQQSTLRLLADQVIAQLELRRARTLLEAQCSTDDVTGVWNRHAFERRLAEEWARWGRHGGDLALLAIDVDHFKHYNDQHGHPRGDEALQQMARALESTLRGHDVLAHFGAGEFGVLLPATDAAGAMSAAERVHRAVDAMRWALEPLTVSVGVAVAVRGSDVEPGALAGRAHRALTHAKGRGRHCVELCLDERETQR